MYNYLHKQSSEIHISLSVLLRHNTNTAIYTIAIQKMYYPEIKLIDNRIKV